MKTSMMMMVHALVVCVFAGLLSAQAPVPKAKKKEQQRGGIKFKLEKMPRLVDIPFIEVQRGSVTPLVIPTSFRTSLVPFRPAFRGPEYDQALSRLLTAQLHLQQARTAEAARKALDELDRATMALRRALWKREEARKAKAAQPKNGPKKGTVK